jgi:hypothetical protein
MLLGQIQEEPQKMAINPTKISRNHQERWARKAKGHMTHAKRPRYKPRRRRQGNQIRHGGTKRIYKNQRRHLESVSGEIGFNFPSLGFLIRFEDRLCIK